MTNPASSLPDDLRALREAMYDVGYRSPNHAYASPRGKRAAQEAAAAAESRILSTVSELTAERDALKARAVEAEREWGIWQSRAELYVKARVRREYEPTESLVLTFRMDRRTLETIKGGMEVALANAFIYVTKNYRAVLANRAANDAPALRGE